MHRFDSAARRTRIIKAAVATASLLLAAQGALAQTYPNKPVRMIDPYAPGGSTSVVSRAFSQKFQELTGQPMVVEYKPGAASNIGSDQVAKATPDGYTVLLGTSSLAINPHLYRNMPFDPLKDLAPVMSLIRTPNVLAVHPSLPVKSVRELIEYARANPGKLNYGSSGNGATNHMAMEALKAAAKIDLVHVPFKGGSEAMAAAVGGQIQVLFNPASTLAPQDRAGRLRMIAVSSSQRVPGLELPTVAEAGVPGFDSQVWFALFLPAGTPAAIVTKLNADSNRILADRQVQEVLNKAGLNPVGGSAEDLRKTLVGDYEKWGAIVKSANIRIE